MNKILSLTLLFMLSACVMGTSQPAKFYTLRSDVSDSTYVNDKVKLSIGINSASIPDYLDKPQIVTLKSNSVELNISEMNRWSESLSTMISRTLAGDLAIALPNSVVKTKTTGRENFDYTIQLEVNRFEGIWDENAVLNAWWVVLNKNNKVVFREKSELSTPISDDYDSLVVGQSKLISQLAQEIAAKVSGLK